MKKKKKKEKEKLTLARELSVPRVSSFSRAHFDIVW